jgi:hypothetical protein
MDNRKVKTNDVIEFLYKAEINWVIIKKDGKPLCWPDGNVKVYSNIDDLMVDYDKKSGDAIMTEFAFIEKMMEDYCCYDRYLESK